jgi:hypothetical protein
LAIAFLEAALFCGLALAALWAARHFGWFGDFFAYYKVTKEQAAEEEPMRPIPIQTWIKAIRFATK